jgi:GNAT superfamily N-acetyltransferase
MVCASSKKTYPRPLALPDCLPSRRSAGTNQRVAGGWAFGHHARVETYNNNPPLPDGYSPVPPGKLVNAVTFVEMCERPTRSRASNDTSSLAISRWRSPDLDAYRALYRAVGEDWMWVSRLELSDEALKAVLHDPRVEVYVLSDGAKRIGLLELDFRIEHACEVAYFGVVKDAIGKGAGRFMMDFAIDTAWKHPIRRLWLHTCHFDHPGAVAFYQRSGFEPYAFMIEVADDPRLTGLMPRTAAPHIPLLER